jgi:hypothetical protein
MILVFLP